MKRPVPKPYVILCYCLFFCFLYYIFVYRNRRNYITSAEFLDTLPCRPLRAASRDLSDRMCTTNCKTGQPCEYSDVIDLRIIILTFNRPKSLEKCLKHVANIDTCGDRIGVEIWVDKSKSGRVDDETLRIAENFSQSWTKGRVCVHVQERNAYIIGQWIDSWRPKPNTTELALILEDDIDISPLAYRWLRTMNAHFASYPEVAGYGLQMENVQTVRGRRRPLHGPETDAVFLYAQVPTWGFAPEPNFWRRFQDWFHEKRKDPDFHPYVPDIISTQWYKDMERRNKQDSMWSMWLKYFCYIHEMYSVYPNLQTYTGRYDVLLDTNRMEKGLHYGASGHKDASNLLLNHWYKTFEVIPSTVTRYGYDGGRISLRSNHRNH